MTTQRADDWLFFGCQCWFTACQLSALFGLSFTWPARRYLARAARKAARA
jgi:hypothetical protein